MSEGRGATRRRKDERPGEILDAAFEEFSRTGYAGTKLDDVAARAGITKGTIYVYFASKEDLFFATISELCRPIQEHLAGLMEAPEGPAIEILRVHFGFVYEHMVSCRRGREVFRLLCAEASRFPELVERWHAEVIGPAIALLSSVVRYGVERGEFRETAVAAFPQLLFAPVLMASHWLIIFGDSRPLDLRRYLDGHLDLLARGIVADGRAETA